MKKHIRKNNMDLLIAAGMWILYLIINSLAWAWIGICLGYGALIAYELFGGNIRNASKALKNNEITNMS
jgi:anthranilate/para-aminobenzoate synthase component II